MLPKSGSLTSISQLGLLHTKSPPDPVLLLLVTHIISQPLALHLQAYLTSVPFCEKRGPGFIPVTQAHFHNRFIYHIHALTTRRLRVSEPTLFSHTFRNKSTTHFRYPQTRFTPLQKWANSDDSRVYSRQWPSLSLA